MADTKISALDAIAAIAGEDLIAAIDDPSGTPASKKATITQVATFLRSLSETLTNKTIDWTDNTMALTSLELLTALSDETGTGSAVFATSPTLVTPVLGTPASGTLTNCTGLPLAGLSEPPRFIFGRSQASTATNAIFYPAYYGAVSQTVESDTNLTVGFDFQVNAVRIIVNANTKNAATTAGFRDDGVTLGSTSITASTTGIFETASLTNNVASGSLCNFIFDTSSSSSGSIAYQTFTCEAQPN